MNFFDKLLCAVVVGEGEVVYHAVERKVVAYDNSVWGKVVFVFFEKLYVLSLCGINKNQIKLSFKLAVKRIFVNVSDAV